ncbi:MAG: hypothetical protein SFV21_00075 [Rhodospirillaceae bacterium]|nr:hypothetical protein [Rhodospirillaceae bacterium]
MPHRLIRTATQNWTPDPEIPGFKQQILLRNAARKSVVRKWFVPPDWGVDILKGKPDRHYHRSVIERAYNLGGDFPHWEFSSVADFKGELIVFRRHTVMDRPPGSLHGLLPTPRAQAGAEILYWNTGPGTSIAEKAFARETVKVPFDKRAKVGRDDFPAARIFQADALAWQRHPRVTGLKIKPLMPAVDGAGQTAVVSVPADWMPSAPVEIAAPPSETAWLYMLSGDMRLKVGEPGAAGDMTLGEGDFLAWDGGTDVRFGQGEASGGGATVLCTGHALG